MEELQRCHDERYTHIHLTTHDRLLETKQEEAAVNEREGTRQGEEERRGVQAIYSNTRRPRLHDVLQFKAILTSGSSVFVLNRADACNDDMTT